MPNFKKPGWLFILVLLFITVLSVVLLHTRADKRSLISPILGVSKLRIADNLWFPKQHFFTQEVKAAPQVTSQAAFFVDTATGDVLYEKNSKERLPIASLTKIMTAVVALENKQFSDELKVSERAAGMEPDKMLLIGGERLSVEELLGGVFLVSANDAAEVLAEEVTGRREEFINLMNSKAAQLGMKDTLFINPTGLQEDSKKQYSTAYDVALMSRYAIHRWSKLLEISSKPHIYLPKTEAHQDYDLYSGINLLTTYPGVIGFKTGFTPEAGLTLVTVARKEGREVLGVLLGSTDRRDDARELLDYSFKKLGL